MKVFEIDVDMVNCSYILPSDDNYSNGYLDFNKLRKDWNGIELYLHNLKKNYAHFNYFRSEALCISDVGATLIMEYLNKYGQLLPVEVERKGQAFIFNVKHYLDCLAPETTIVGGNYILIKTKIDKPIFKLSAVPFGPVFCTSGLLEPHEEFYHIYHEKNMTGLKFTEIEGLI